MKKIRKKFSSLGIRDKKYTGISRENAIKIRSHHGATTIDICNYIKPELRQKPDVVIVHCGTNDIPNNINTVKKIKKLIKEIEENNHEEEGGQGGQTRRAISLYKSPFAL